MKMRSPLATLALPSLALLTLTLGGCAHERSEARPEETEETAETAPEQVRPEEAAPGGERGMMRESCPMDLPGTQLQVRDVEGGVAMDFTTTKPEQLAELRRRVRMEATMIAHHHAMGGRGPGPQGRAAPPPEEMPAPTETGPLTYDVPGMKVTVEDVPDGAQMVLMPDDPQRLAMMREHLHRHAEHMEAGTCPMEGMWREGEPAPGYEAPGYYEGEDEGPAYEGEAPDEGYGPEDEGPAPGDEGSDDDE